MRVMVGEMVAEKSAVWRSAGVAARIVSRSSAKPMSSISSASSRITTATSSKRRLPRLRWSTARPGRRDHDVDAPPQAAQLLADRLAAVDRQDAGAELTAVGVERLGDLHRELAGRDEDERRGTALAGRADRDALEHRQREGRGLAGPGRRLREQVAAGQQRRDGLALDRRRLLVAERRDRAQQPRVEVEPGEAVARGVRPAPRSVPSAGARVVVGRGLPSSSGRVRSAGPDDRVEVDRPDAARPAAIGPDRGRRDDAGDRAAR